MSFSQEVLRLPLGDSRLPIYRIDLWLIYTNALRFDFDCTTIEKLNPDYFKGFFPG